MKTNKILMAMALAAGFTACTSEDVVESTQVNALSNRKVLGDVEFVMGGTDSRFALEDGVWSLEAEDAFGAALIDVPNGKESENAWENYNLTKHIQTNYKYAKGEGNVFSTPALMVEGNYVFYAPYNKKHLTRKPLEVKFPITQTLDVVDGKVVPTSPINNAVKEGYPFFVDYKFLSATAQENDLTINFKHLYSYPEVKFVNDTEEDIDIEKFVVNLGTQTISVDGTLNLAGGNETVASSAVNGIVGNLFNLGTEITDAEEEGDDVEDWGAWVDYQVREINGLIKGKTSDLVNGEGAQTTHITIEIPEGLTVKAGEEVAFNIVMPAEEYDGLNVYAVVDAKKGYAYSKALNIDPQLLSGKRFPLSDYVPSTGKLKATDKIGKTFTRVVEEEEKAANIEEYIIAPVVVSTTTELINAIDDTKGNLNVIAGEEVVYNQNVADALGDSDVATLKFLSDMTIVGGADSENVLSIKGIEFSGKAIIKSGYVEGGALANVVVEKDAYYTSGNVTALLVNNGNVTLAKAAVIAKAENNATGTIEVGADGATITEIVNKGIVKIGGQLTTTMAKFGNFQAKDATKNIEGYCGTVKVTGKYTTNFTELNGDWDVSGTLTLPAAVAINKSLDIEAAGKLEGTSVVTINNATVNIYGTVGNNITVKLNGHDDISDTNADRTATLNAKEGAKIMGAITSQTDEPKMNVMSVEKDVYFLKTQTLGYITSTYTHVGNLVDMTKDLAFVPAKSVVNRVVIDGNIQNTTELTLPAGWTGVTEIKVNNIYCADANVTLPGKVVVVGDVFVASGRTMAFSGASVEIGGTLTNEGTVTFVAAEAIELNKVISSATIAMPSVTDLTLNGDITISHASDAVKLTLNTTDASTVHVEGDVTLTTDVDATKGAEFIVYQKKTLKIDTDEVIAGVDGKTIVFTPSYLTGPNDETDYSSKTAAQLAELYGKVNNEGKVHYAEVAYAENASTFATGKGWWTGDAAWIAAVAP